MSNDALLELNIPELTKVKSGKVREVFDMGEHLLFVASDRVSAFDVVLPNGIPRKGEVLTQISHFWFDKYADLVPNHRVVDGLPDHLAHLAPRSMVVKKAEPLNIECIVRGYITGSGWKEYKKNGTVCDIPLPDDLLESAELEQPLFTPSTKADEGHDENISFEQAVEIEGRETAEKVRDLSLQIYTEARNYARERGIIIADTKFEFGRIEGELILIDEVLTPDSSRFWPLDEYEPGRGQHAFDKQYVRDYLETLDWDKAPPGPELPAEIIEKSQARYLEAYQRLTGTEL
ncbi:MAG: phosphoribosylaminoimidazolesuccinocarboxamide synthase [Verrucomicrobiales bacterium]|nr:phosphoribosylaminoimidazolesuccinocarboxamide synthase [Verrucomicrobiales bacterium]MBT5845142.1 phosphoribosylaminoimidazolesuccinocarboxamide synthase [Verrucomicrobiales bacterium]